MGLFSARNWEIWKWQVDNGPDISDNSRRHFGARRLRPTEPGSDDERAKCPALPLTALPPNRAVPCRSSGGVTSQPTRGPITPPQLLRLRRSVARTVGAGR